MNKKGFVIAIDGPVAAGKGTIAPLIAKRLNGLFLNTGAMYRAFALHCENEDLDISDTDDLKEAVEDVEIDFVNGRVLLEGEDVTSEINTEEIGYIASTVSMDANVRLVIGKKQQEIAQKIIDEGKIVVAEGRDAATRVFPGAKLKVFLTADVETRAKRRLLQIEEKGEKREIESVIEGIKTRDIQDSTRDLDPLVSDPEKHGYFLLDNSNMTEKETVDKIIERIDIN